MIQSLCGITSEKIKEDTQMTWARQLGASVATLSAQLQVLRVYSPIFDTWMQFHEFLETYWRTEK